MGKRITFGQVREIPKDANESRIIPFTLSTPQRDRHHTKVNQDNWELDNYRKNPVVGYMHNLYGDMCNPPDPDDVIGHDMGLSFEDIEGAKCLCGLTAFDPADVNLKAEKIFRKVLLGTLRATSVGFLDIGHGSWGRGEEAEGRDNETFYFEGQELLEYSIVSIPSNAGATKKGLDTYMRANTYSAIMYAFEHLGKKFRLSQIEEMRVRDVLDLLDGKDLEIQETDPDKVRKQLEEDQAKKDAEDIIRGQQRRLLFEVPKHIGMN